MFLNGVQWHRGHARSLIFSHPWGTFSIYSIRFCSIFNLFSPTDFSVWLKAFNYFMQFYKVILAVENTFEYLFSLSSPSFFSPLQLQPFIRFLFLFYWIVALNDCCFTNENISFVIQCFFSHRKLLSRSDDEDEDMDY